MASSASRSLSNSMKAKDPYDSRSEKTKERRRGASRRLAVSRLWWRRSSKYLVVNVALSKLLKFVNEVGLADVLGDVANEQTHFLLLIIKFYYFRLLD